MLQDMASTYKMLLNGLTQFADNVAVNSGRLVVPAARDAYIDMNDLKSWILHRIRLSILKK
jgi:hypothetical protein